MTIVYIVLGVCVYGAVIHFCMALGAAAKRGDESSQRAAKPRPDRVSGQRVWSESWGEWEWIDPDYIMQEAIIEYEDWLESLPVTNESLRSDSR